MIDGPTGAVASQRVLPMLRSQSTGQISSARYLPPCLSHMFCCSTLNGMRTPSQNPMSIKDAPSDIKSDRVLVLNATKKDPNAVLHSFGRSALRTR